MSSRLKVYITVLILIILGILYTEYNKPKKVNWFPTYAAKHKIPYGTYILRKELPSIFKKNIKDVYRPPYEFLKDTTVNGTYFFLDKAFNFGKEEFEQLLAFTKRGNDVFISTDGANIDALNLQSESLFTTNFKERFSVNLVNPKLSSNTCMFDKAFSKIVLSKLDTTQTTVLGELVVTNEQDSIIGKGVNFIQMKMGEGNLFIHTFPEAFTNYSLLLGNNKDYVASVLSYLDVNKPILWDAYYKTGKSTITSPMHFILNAKGLKWAYYTILIGVLFFVLFKGKRNQRVIPVIHPIKNQTLAFTRTIAGMYFEKSDHKNIATHKINYFLEYVRTTYRISTLQINDVFYKKLASRSLNSEEDVINLFKLVQLIQNKTQITKEELTELNTAIEKFKKI